jgi:hypothetical protein
MLERCWVAWAMTQIVPATEVQGGRNSRVKQSQRCRAQAAVERMFDAALEAMMDQLFRPSCMLAASTEWPLNCKNHGTCLCNIMNAMFVVHVVAVTDEPGSAGIFDVSCQSYAALYQTPIYCV